MKGVQLMNPNEQFLSQRDCSAVITGLPYGAVESAMHEQPNMIGADLVHHANQCRSNLGPEDGKVNHDRQVHDWLGADQCPHLIA